MNETNERAMRKQIRRLMRERRRNLDRRARDIAARHLCRHLLALVRFRHARNIAAYLAVDGEMSLQPVIETAWSLNIPVYLPCLRGLRMEFRRYTPETPLRRNHVGIPEPAPAAGTTLSARFLDVVLAPLVAFDGSGGRLGTGGGYYDRTFQFLQDRKYWNRPTLIGVAYEFQQVSALPLASWDIPMHGVVTDARTRTF